MKKKSIALYNLNIISFYNLYRYLRVQKILNFIKF